MKKTPKIVVIEGPSGAGKDTVIRELIRRYPNKYIKMISMTSREMRDGEAQGNPYIFVTRAQFEEKIKSGEVFEYTIMSRDDHYRGMSKQIIDKNIADGLISLKDCDWVGIDALKKTYGDADVLAVYLHVEKEEIARRIAARGGSDEDMQRRLADYDQYSVQIRAACDIEVGNCEVGKCVDELHKVICNG
ncbi:MAG: AAA family ATPase [Firmicutes bacterium]|nr:AAA family ATPase [Bacillota bacterium]